MNTSRKSGDEQRHVASYAFVPLTNLLSIHSRSCPHVEGAAEENMAVSASRHAGPVSPTSKTISVDKMFDEYLRLVPGDTELTFAFTTLAFY